MVRNTTPLYCFSLETDKKFTNVSDVSASFEKQICRFYFFVYLKPGGFFDLKAFSVMGLSFQIRMQNREKTNTFQSAILILWIVFFSKDTVLEPTFANDEN